MIGHVSKQPLLTQFQIIETPEAIWKDIRRVWQRYEEDIRGFIRRFEDLYSILERLKNDLVSPDFMKCDQFIVALHEDIKEKVDDKCEVNFCCKKRPWQIHRILSSMRIKHNVKGSRVKRRRKLKGYEVRGVFQK